MNKLLTNVVERILDAIRVAFGNLPYLYLIPLVVVLLVLLVRWATRRRQRALARFANAPVLDGLLSSVNPSRQKLRAALIIIAIALVLLALARPRYGEREVQLSARGVDVVILLDTSRSMLAEDIGPNRFERAKLEILRLISHLRSHRVALVVFAGRAHVQCPLTMDYGAFSMFLKSVQVGSVEVGGTALPSAIEKACNLFAAGEQQYKTLVVFSDGESHSGDLEAAAREASKQGVIIHSVAVGTAQGAPIPVREESGGLKEYRRDRDRNVIISKLNLTGLARAAEITGGKTVQLSGRGGGSGPISAAIAQMVRKELQSRTVVVYNERFQYPLLVAILLIIIALVLPTRAKNATGSRRGE
ncbi:VWA domain-containing protein [bacterium]|nr:VWA domain-containing protein [bacterium]